MRLVEQGVVALDDVITHTLPLAKAWRAYQFGNGREDNGPRVVRKTPA
jgi:hypothetical protein